MLGYKSEPATGTDGQKLTYNATRAQWVTACEARNATNVSQIQLAMGIKEGYTAVCLARGSMACVGDQIKWSGKILLHPDQEIVAYFYGTTALDKLELTVNVESIKDGS